MILKYYGHACFKLETAVGSVVFDPYVSGYVPGFNLPPLEADLVISSHEHSDHYAPESVKLSGREHGLKIEQIETFHYIAVKELFRVLRRRTQKNKINWDKYKEILKHLPIAPPRIRVNIYD